MKKLKRLIVVSAALLLVCALTSCGKKSAEITFIGLSETNVLNIQYEAKSNIKKDEFQIKVIVSGEGGNASGTVYCIAEQNEDLVKGKKYFALFDMTSEHLWKADGGVNMMGGTFVGEGITTTDILMLFGEDAKISAEFVINGETVSAMSIGE